VNPVASALRQPLLAARITPEKKARFAALAASRGMTESGLLTRLVDQVLDWNPEPVAPAAAGNGAQVSDRMTLRLRPGDSKRIRARACERRMKPAGYLAALIRSHVRRDPPMPSRELDELKLAVSQLSAVERRLNHLSVNVGPQPSSGLLEELRETVRRVEHVREQVFEVVRINVMSWETGDV
jgi:hypothetical protein